MRGARSPPAGARLAALLWAGAAAGLRLEVNVHYPEHNSPMEYCGLTLQVATPLSDPSRLTSMTRAGRDLFKASLDLPDELLYTATSVAVMANVGDGTSSRGCMAVCPRLGPQGQLVQTGPYPETEVLGLYNKIDLWPSFCGLEGGWRATNVTYHSKAIGRHVSIKVRAPAAALENALPRPARLLPPVMLRFNPEWYFTDAGDGYTAWHGLMVNGAMQPVVMAEVYVEGADWNQWLTQPILSTTLPRRTCRRCDPELRFACDDWERSGHKLYSGGDHAYGRAEAFFDELHEVAVPRLLGELPRSSDGLVPRLGVWGYCIGGLAAWNALTLRPGRFSFAYLGSVAMDFDCGSPFEAVANFSWPSGSPPKVYIDSGALEDAMMSRMSKLLLRRLEAKGLIEGRDVFYEQAPFGTHQSRTILRRALRGLLVLFGEGSADRAAHAPVRQEVSAVGEDGHSTTGWIAALCAACSLVAFSAGLLVADCGFRGRGGRKGRAPLLS